MSTTYPEVVKYLLHAYGNDDVIDKTNVTLTRLTQPLTMSSTQYEEALVATSLRREDMCDEYVLKGIFIEGLQESVRRSGRSYWSTHPKSTLYHLARHATSLQALQKGTEVHSEKEGDHRRSTTNRRGRRGNSLSAVVVIRTGGSTLTTSATQTTNASAVVQKESNPQLIPMKATSFTSGYSTTYVDSDFFCRERLEKSHRQAERPFVSNHLRKRFPAQCENNLNDLLPEAQKRFGYQPASASSRRPPQVPAK